MLTGVAVGGVIPIAFSLLGDMFPASQRNAVVALAQMAMGTGVCLGQVRAAAAAAAGPLAPPEALGTERRPRCMSPRCAPPFQATRLRCRAANPPQMLAGFLGPATNWRVPYLAVAAPSLLLAVLVGFTIDDPPR